MNMYYENINISMYLGNSQIKNISVLVRGHVFYTLWTHEPTMCMIAT